MRIPTDSQDVRRTPGRNNIVLTTYQRYHWSTTNHIFKVIQISRCIVLNSNSSYISKNRCTRTKYSNPSVTVITRHCTYYTTNRMLEKMKYYQSHFRSTYSLIIRNVFRHPFRIIHQFPRYIIFRKYSY